jgi:hypothetical protein
MSTLVKTDPAAFNEWLQAPVTRAFVKSLSDSYGSDLRALAADVAKGGTKAQALAGRIAKTEEILSVLRAVPAELEVSLYGDEDDDAPDPATQVSITDYQTTTHRGPQ